MIRSKQDIINDFLKWLAKKKGDESLLPENHLETADEQEKLERSAVVWRDLHKLCYDPVHGMYYFVKFVLGDLTNAGYPAPIRFNKLWLDWSKRVQMSEHICIECPRQHSKTTFFTVIYPLYKMAMYRQYNVAIVSASEEQAVMILAFISNIIKTNEYLKSKVAKSAKWSSTEISYNEGVARAKGVGSEIRGGTYDLVVMDDILRSDNKLSDNDTENYVKEEVEATILVRKGQIIIVGTPKSPTDIFSNIEDMIDETPECGWVFKRYQAVIDYDTKEILCPDRFTFSQLMKKRRIIGQLKFDKEFQCQVYSSGSQLFQDSVVKRATDKGKEWSVEHNNPDAQDINSPTRYYVGVDVARSGSASADATVITVLAYNEDTRRKRVAHVCRKKGMKISEQSRIIAHISEQFGHPIILVEKNNIGQDMVDELIDEHGLSVETFNTTKKSKDDLIRKLVAAFENEQIIIPYKTEEDREHMKQLLNELHNFVVEVTRAGNEVMKGAGKKKDDCVMSLAIANKCSESSNAKSFATVYKTGGNDNTEERKFDTELERYAERGNIEDILKL